MGYSMGLSRGNLGLYYCVGGSIQLRVPQENWRVYTRGEFRALGLGF